MAYTFSVANKARNSYGLYIVMASMVMASIVMAYTFLVAEKARKCLPPIPVYMSVRTSAHMSLHVSPDTHAHAHVYTHVFT